MRPIQYIKKEVEEDLRKTGVIEYKPVNKDNFKSVVYQVLDPISEEILREYNFTLNEFNKLNFTEKRKYSKLKKIEKVDKPGFIKETQRQSKIKNIYVTLFNDCYLKRIKKENISNKTHKIFESIMDEVLGTFTFKGFGNQAESKSEMDFEKKILMGIKSNI